MKQEALSQDRPSYTQQIQNILNESWRTIRLIASAAPEAFAGFSILALLTSIDPIVEVWLSKQVTNAIVAKDLFSSLLLAALYAGTLILPLALAPLLNMLEARVGNRLLIAVDRILMEIGERLVDLHQIETSTFQDEIQLIGDAMWITNKVFKVFQEGAGSVLTITGLLLLLGGLNPLLPLALILMTLPRFFSENRLRRLTVEVMGERSRAAREMSYCTGMVTDPASAKEVRVFGLGDFFLDRFRTRFKTAVAEVTRVRLKSLYISLTFTGLYTLVLIGGFWYVANRASVGKLTIGDVALYINALIQLEIMFSPLWTIYGLAYESLLYFRRLFNLMDNARPVIAQSNWGGAIAAPDRLKTGIVLQHVAFTYPDSSVQVLQDVSFEMPAGKVTALVGINGAGKTTIVKLLTRMYDPTGGSILLDAIPIQQYELKSLRQRIAVFYQDFARFYLTMRSNIEAGARVGRQPGFRTYKAAVISGADEVAQKLPRGYETELTRHFQGGVDLSGGEWQKVALARAFIRDAGIVILDEPTAALDAEAEHRLFEHFQTLIKGRTALIISHRFSTVRMADYIVVLDKGRIIEKGSHAELMAQRGYYAELFEMQAKRYR